MIYIILILFYHFVTSKSNNFLHTNSLNLNVINLFKIFSPKKSQPKKQLDNLCKRLENIEFLQVFKEIVAIICNIIIFDYFAT